MSRQRTRGKQFCLPFSHTLLIGLFAVLLPDTVFASEAQLAFTVHNLWLLIATALVFTMHLGFACVEAGMTQSRNTVNILFKNTAILGIGLLTYAAIGFSLMYPGESFGGGFFGFAGFGLNPGENAMTPGYNPSYTYWTDFIFQAMFAATAATIVSGAVAERVKLVPFLIFSTLFVSFCYPIIGMWKWGGGFLNTLSTPFYDFAGSSLVHSVGGWAALVGAIAVGPRLGRYTEGFQKSFEPSNLPLATIGMFLLWLGWFGFNGGSVLSADPAALSLVFVTTTLGGAAGMMGAVGMSWFRNGKADLGMALNGALAGLVSITAGADQFSPLSAIAVGYVGGLLVVLSVALLDRLKVDDPVSAISVHLSCGIWGTLAVGLFGNLASFSQFRSQLLGVGAIAAMSIAFSAIVFFALKHLTGIRVSANEEKDGLDQWEHGVAAYGFLNPAPQWKWTVETPSAPEMAITETLKA